MKIKLITKEFLLYILAFLFIVSFILAITATSIGHINSQQNYTYTNVDDFKKDVLDMYYDMYDAYDYIVENKQTLLSENQFYKIEYTYDHKNYTILDYGEDRLLCRYIIHYDKLNHISSLNGVYKEVNQGDLYIENSIDIQGINITYADSKISYIIDLYIPDYDSTQLESYVDKIVEYIELIEKYN